MRAVLLLLALSTAPVAAQTLVPTRVLRAQTLVGPQDLALLPAATPGALADPAEALGRETRVILYPGRPIRASDLGPPALVERNQLVMLQYRQGNLDILTEGRALARGGAGEMIRVMNLQSRTTVTGRVGPGGVVDVSP